MSIDCDLIVYLPKKKMETEKWPKTADSPLLLVCPSDWIGTQFCNIINLTNLIHEALLRSDPSENAIKAIQMRSVTNAIYNFSLGKI